MPITRRQIMNKKFALIALVLAIIPVLMFAIAPGGVAAASVTPEFIAGSDNKTCTELQGAGQTWIELKVDPNADGTYSDGTLTVTISNTTDDKTFDWSSNIGVDAVFVKAGTEGSYLYRYDPPAESTGDTNLTSPGAGVTNQISHIAFCYDVDPATNTPTNTPTDTPTNTPTDTPTNTPTDTPTNTPVNTATNTPTNTPTVEKGQLKVCKVAGAGVTPGTIFTINVNGTSYNVPAGNNDGLCVLAGQFPINTNVTVQEVIPAGYIVARIEVLPNNRTVSKDLVLGKAVVKIGTGVTEVIFTNKVS